MKIVEEAVRPPGMCLASRDTEGPFIDTGLRAAHRDPYIYLSVRWVEECARELGMVPKVEVNARFAKLEGEQEEYAEQLAGLKRLADAATEFSEATEAVAEQSIEEEVPLPPEASNDIREMVPVGVMDEVSNGSGA